jgi:hypothetical protein
MSKKSDKGSGVSFSPELREVIGRLKRKEPELQEIVNQEGDKDHGEQDNSGNGSTDPAPSA